MPNAGTERPSPETAPSTGTAQEPVASVIGGDAPTVDMDRAREAQRAAAGESVVRPPADLGRVRLRTLTTIRWIVIAIQAIIVLGVAPTLGLDLPYPSLVAVILASVAINMVSALHRGARRRLSDRDATGYLAYDLVQLTVMLTLTGGLGNPFIILLLVPVAVAASILPRGNVVLLSVIAISAATALAVLPRFAPREVPVPDLPVGFLITLWMALGLTIIFLAAYVSRVAQESRRIGDAFLQSQIALARAKQASALGALAAASAHEMGTPLATIAVVARELERDLPPESPMREDVELILEQAKRCRDSLAHLARQPETSGGDPYERLTLSTLMREVMEYHNFGGKYAAVKIESRDGSPEPQTQRSPELLHGLGNLAQNAVQFAKSEAVVTVSWTRDDVRLEIDDDGPGFPPHVLASVGEPYLTTRKPDEGHFGLGIFIATTLIDRTGGETTFRNRPKGGAQVVITWNRHHFEGHGGGGTDGTIGSS